MASNRGRVGGASPLVAAACLTLGACASHGAQAPTVPSASPGAYAYVPGTQLSYRLVYRDVAASDFTSLFRAEQPQVESRTLAPTSYGTSLDATILATVISAGTASAMVDVRFSGVSIAFAMDRQRNASEEASITAGLGRDIVADVDDNGRLLDVRFDPSLDPAARTYAASVLSLMQLVIPTDIPSSCGWRADLDTPNGRLQMGYRAVCEAAALSVTAVPESYVRVSTTLPGQRALPTTIAPTGRLAYLFDRIDRRLRFVRGAFDETVDVSGRRVSTSDSMIDATLLRAGSLDESTFAAVRKRAEQIVATISAQPLWARPDAAAMQSAIDRQTLGTDTADALFAALARLEGLPRSGADTALFLKFKALFSLQPQTSASAAGLLASADARSKSLGLLSLALADAGNGQSQGVLADALRARAGDPDAAAVIELAMTNLPDPDDDVVEAVRTIAFTAPDPNESAEAAMALGALAHQMRAADPIKSGAIVQALVGGLSAATDDRRRAAIILALGNTGSADAYPALSPYLSDPEPALRQDAVLALRWIPLAAADSALATALERDSDTNVRQQAAAAIGQRPPTPSTYDALTAAFAHDADDVVRGRCLFDIWRVRAQEPTATALVESALHDRSAAIRDQARLLLGKS
jgi:HEAT repeat protein